VVRATESVERVARVIEVLASSPEGAGVSEVARALRIHKATASRLLGTLAIHGLVDRDPLTRRYGVGARLVGLAGSAIRHLSIVTHAHPELERLTARTSETTNLAVLDGFDVVYIDQVTPTTSVVMASWVGRRTPAHASSSGKVLLAFGDPAAVERLLSRRLVPLTSRTITDPTRLRRVLAEVRKAGWARSIGELEDGLVTMAAPILADGRPVAAVSLSGPTSRIPPRDHAFLAQMVVDAAKRIGHRVAGRMDPSET
jgi:DNA-binding IclR family transcriptional regulator